MSEFNHNNILKDIINNSIWKTASILQEPETKLIQWQVYRVTFPDEITIHFVGYTGYEGRVCSAIQEFDMAAMKGRTRSGRIYELIGNTGMNMDASYVWNHWLNINGNPSIENISDDFIKDPK